MKIDGPSNTTITLDDGLLSGGVTVFRKQYALDFDNQPDREVVLCEDGVAIALSASTINVDVLSENPAIGEVTTSVDGNSLVVSLPRPYPLHRIDLPLAGQTGKKTMDSRYGAPTGDFVGDSVVERARKTGGAGSTPIAVYRVDVDTVADSPTLNLSSGQSAGVFEAQKFAIRLSDGKGGFEPIDVSKLSKVWVKSLPTGLRAGIMNSKGEIDFFWRKSGRVDAVEKSDKINDSAGVSFAAALQRALDSGEHVLSLVIESDVPCQVVVEPFALSYQLRSRCPFHQPTFQDDLWIAHFSGSGHERTDYTSSLPGHGAVARAYVDTSESFPDPESLYLAAPADFAEPHELDHGITLSAGQRGAQQFEAGKSVECRAAMIAVRPITAKVRLSARIHRDWQGRPEGDIVASGEYEFQGASTRWIRIPIEPGEFVYSENHWLQINVHDGAMVWLSTTEKVSDVFKSAVCWDDAQKQYLTLSARAMLCCLLIKPQNQVPPQRSLEIAVNGEKVQSQAIALAGADTYRHDLTTSLIALGAGAEVTLSLASVQRGQVRLDPLTVIWTTADSPSG